MDLTCLLSPGWVGPGTARKWERSPGPEPGLQGPDCSERINVTGWQELVERLKKDWVCVSGKEESEWMFSILYLRWQGVGRGCQFGV